MDDAVKLGVLTKKVFKAAIDKVEGIIDEEISESHQSICQAIEKSFAHIAQKQQMTGASLVQVQVQSGGAFAPDAASTAANLGYDLIYLAAKLQLGALETQCLRTLIINPKQDMKATYTMLVELFQVLVAALQNGASLAQVYGKVKTVVQSRKPELLKHLHPELGSCRGKSITEGSTDRAAEGDVFAIKLWFNHLPKAKAFQCSSDTMDLLLSLIHI